MDALRKIRARLRTLKDNSEKRSRRHGDRNGDPSKSSSHSKQTYRHHDGDRRQASVRFDMRPRTYYVPDPPQRYQDVEWPQSAGSIEYFPLKQQFPTKEEDEPEFIQLGRLQRSSSVSYQPSKTQAKAYSRRSESTTRYERERGRSRRREPCDASAHADTDSSDEACQEQLGYRSRR